LEYGDFDSQRMDVWLRGEKCYRATAPAGSGPQGTAIAVAGLAFLGFAFLQKHNLV
jgi:hypothetical protein